MTDTLLIVEDTFTAHGEGIVLSPFLPAQPSRKVRVRYETPDGGGGIVAAHIETTVGRTWAPGHLSPPHPSAIVIDAATMTIPTGTRIWIVED